MDRQIVTPAAVEAANGIDYGALVEHFGAAPITRTLIERFEAATGTKAHPMLRRGQYISHRDLDVVLDLYEKGAPLYLYTGLGPSAETMHIGHMLPFIFTRYLQRVFDCALVIQLTNDEKFFWKPLTLDQTTALARENAKDIIAFGFIPEKTFIFIDTDYIKEMYPNVCKIQKKVTYNQVKAIFGFEGSENCGMVAFPAIQAAPSFSSSLTGLLGPTPVRCLVPCAIDQDPYFRMARDVAPRLGEPKPALIHCKFVSGLHGVGTKMSSSDPSTAVLLSDTPDQIRAKIVASKSGGGETLKAHREHGATIADDVAFEYLTLFMDDDSELDRLRAEYTAGRVTTGEVKKVLIELLTRIILEFQHDRETVTEAVVDEYMKIRRLA